MGEKTTRDFIVAAADQLFYQQGFEHTSLSHIADEVKISKGNFYHHFKSKDKILDAVIQLRMANTQIMLTKWEVEGEQPFDRIKSFINILLVNQNKIKKYGCPVGTLTSELAKLNHSAQNEANEIFSLFRAWLSEQFTLLGYEEKADKLAMHILARSQGVATLANAFQDQVFINHEVEKMYEWLMPYSQK
jgi:AcrR family transcriptional regulator